MHVHMNIPHRTQEWDTAPALGQGSTAGPAQSLGKGQKLFLFIRLRRQEVKAGLARAGSVSAVIGRPGRCEGWVMSPTC